MCSSDLAIVEDAILGCKDSAEVTVIEPAQILTSIDSTNSTCYELDNGTAIVNASNGVGGYTYVWTTEAGDTVSVLQDAANLAPGKHYVYVTDDDGNGCKVVDSVNIAEPTEIILAGFQIDSTECGGTTGTITITPDGGTRAAGVNPYTYTWEHDGGLTDSVAPGLGVGRYRFTITDGNSCTYNDFLDMVDAGAITITGFDTTRVSSAGVCDGELTVEFTGNMGIPAFIWSSLNNGPFLYH